MADHKITDFVDQSAIDRLQELAREMGKVKDTYVDTARELAKGINVKVSGLDDLQKIVDLYNNSTGKAATATQQLTKTVEEQNKIVATTTNTISRQLAEQEKMNKANREAWTEQDKVRQLIEKINGTYDQNVQRLIEVTKQLKDAKAAQATLDDALSAGNITAQQHAAAKLELTKRERELAQEKQNLNTILKNEERLNLAVDGSYNGLSQQLELLKKTYKSLTEEQKASPLGKEMESVIQGLDAHLKDMAADMGEFQRNVGNYAIAGQSVRAQLKDLVMEIATLTIQYRSLSDEEKNTAEGKAMAAHIQELTEKAGTLRDAVADTQKAITNAASDTRAFDQISGGIQLLISGFGFATGAAKMLGLQEDELLEVQTKLQAAIVASNALTKIQTQLQKESALMQGVAAIQAKAHSVAINIKTAAEGKGVIVTKAATVAQAAFNAVAKANPYVLLATVILAVVAGVWSLVKANKSHKQSEEDAKKATEERTKALEKQKEAQERAKQAAVDSAAKQIKAYADLRREWSLLSTDMEKAQWLETTKDKWAELGLAVNDVNAAEKILTQMTDTVKNAIIQRALIDAYQSKLKNVAQAYADASISNQTASYKKATAGSSDLTSEERKSLGVTQTRGGGIAKSDNYYLDRSGNIVMTEQGAQIINQQRQEKAIADARQAQKDATAAYERDTEKIVQGLNKTTDKLNAATAQLTSIPGVSAAGSGATASGSGASSSTTEKEDAVKTAAEIEDETQRLHLESVNAQLAVTKEGTQRWLDLKKESIELSASREIAAQQKTADELMDELEKSRAAGGISDQESADRRAEIEQDLADKIRAIEDKKASDTAEAERKRTETLLDEIQTRYANEQSARDLDYQRDQTALKKKYAAGEISREEYESQCAQLSERYATATAAAAVDMLEEILAQENLTADERERLTDELEKARIDAETAAADSAIAEMERVKTHDDKLRDQRLANLKKWMDYASSAMSAISDLADAIYDAKIEKVEEELDAVSDAYDAESDELDDMVDKGVITEEEGEARKRAAKKKTEQKEEELTKKKQQLQYRQAVWDKANTIAQIGLSTALALMQLWVNPGWPTAIPMQAVVAALGALQLATALATPIPKYAKGTDHHPGGLAIVGDAGKAEVVETPNGYYVTPATPTLVDIPKGAVVHPDLSRMIAEDMLTEIPRAITTNAGGNAPKVIVNNDYKTLERKTDETNQLLRASIRMQRHLSYIEQFERFKLSRGL